MASARLRFIPEALVASAQARQAVPKLPSWTWQHIGATVTANPRGRLLPGLHALDLAHWILHDKEEAKTIAATKSRLLGVEGLPTREAISHVADHRSIRYRSSPESLPAQREFLDLLVQHLIERFPASFRKEGDDLICVDHAQVYRPSDFHEAPLLLVSLLCQEDFALVSNTTIKAGSICFSFSKLDQRFQQHLDHVHAKVDTYEQDLRNPVNRFFAGSISPDRPMWRTNFGLAWSGGLVSSANRYPFRANATEKPLAEDPVAYLNALLEEKGDVGHAVWLKVEYQTLRTLPQHLDYTIFGIRTYIDPLHSLSKEAARQLAANLRSLEHSEFRRYLGVDHPTVIDRILDYLDAKADSKM